VRIVSVSLQISLGTAAANYEGAAALWCSLGLRPRLIEVGFSTGSSVSISYQIRRVTISGIPVKNVSVPLIAEDDNPEQAASGPSGVWITPSFSSTGITQTTNWAQKPVFDSALSIRSSRTGGAVGSAMSVFPRGITFSADSPLMICTQQTDTSFDFWAVVAL